MDEEYLAVDESAPVVHPLELESGLYRHHLHTAEVFFQLVALLRKPFQEEISDVEAQHAVFG